jgi:hypothetical protein
MPERSKGPRLWFRFASRSSDRRIAHAGTWLVRGDCGYSESARCGHDHRQRPEQALSNYIVSKQVTQVATENVMPLQSRSPTFVDGRANAMMAWSRVPWELAGDVDAQG